MKPTLIAAVVLAVTIGLAPRSKAVKYRPDITAKAQGNHPAPLSPLVEGEQAKSGKQSSADDSPDGNASSQRVLIVVTGVTALFIMWQAYETRRAAKAAAASVLAISRQADIMERQTKATEDTAHATARSIELVIEKERARISVDAPEKLMLVAGQPITAIKYRIQILAPTPAIVIEARFMAWVTETSNPTEPPITLSIGISASETRKDGTLERLALLFESVNEELIEAVSTQRKFVRFSGFIKYRDVFQPSDAEPHETKFGYLWVVTGALGKIAGPPQSFWNRIGDNYES